MRLVIGSLDVDCRNDSTEPMFERMLKMMAVSSHEKELLKNIYEENKSLFEKMFDVITKDDEEDKREILIALNNINKRFKVNKWLYNGNIYTSKELLK